MSKLKIARKLMTRADIRAHKSPFQTLEWIKRKVAIRNRVEKQQNEAHERALARKQARKTHA